MRVTRSSTERRCAICERTLLMGERTFRFAPNGNGQFVDVCPLCQEIAVESGWLKEGSPTTLTVAQPRKRRRLSLASILGLQPRGTEQPVASEPILRRLSEPELAMVAAADYFNGSQYRRTVGGIAKSLGLPNVSVVPLSGVNADVVVTVAWELSWYQYRITPESTQPVRLAGRGHEVDELEGSFTEWNAHMEGDGRIVPDIARL
ncbi:MAG: hypothetical protein JO186_09205 [Actinobacteria bacterium]|nr:hypothetical protein [Actinomycetota bacterium]MBV8396952.1 hypothetical protein [Actinomycetota bacterium]